MPLNFEWDEQKAKTIAVDVKLSPPRGGWRRSARHAKPARASASQEGVACGVGFRMARGAPPSTRRRSGYDKY